VAFAHELYPRLRRGLEPAVEGGVEPSGHMKGVAASPSPLAYPFTQLPPNTMDENFGAGVGQGSLHC
jgi:hypothetical protein